MTGVRLSKCSSVDLLVNGHDHSGRCWRGVELHPSACTHRTTPLMPCTTRDSDSDVEAGRVVCLLTPSLVSILTISLLTVPAHNPCTCPSSQPPFIQCTEAGEGWWHLVCMSGFVHVRPSINRAPPREPTQPTPKGERARSRAPGCGW